MEKKKLKKLAKALGAKVITDPKERKRFEEKYGIPLSLGDREIETCGNCKHWDTAGFSFHKDASVGKCRLVARHWYPQANDKMIAFDGLEHTCWLASELISVITRRKFGCNQFKPDGKKPA